MDDLYFGIWLQALLPAIIIIIVLVFFLILLKFFISFLNNKNNQQSKVVDKNVYFRDIPCFNNLNIAYYLLHNFSNYKDKELKNSIVNAYLLLWYKNGYIDIISEKALLFKNSNYKIDLKDEIWEKNSFESELYNFLKNAARNNNILEKNELKNYCSIGINGMRFDFIFSRLLEETESELIANNLISVIPSKDYIFFKTQPKYTLSDDLLNEYKNLLGLKNFLLDFSNIEEKRHIEVYIWEQYLIFANLLGIADKVKEQFSKIYPTTDIINTIFAPSLDHTIIRNLTTVYKAVLIQTFGIIIVTILAGLLFWRSGTLIGRIIDTLPLMAVIVIIFLPLRYYLINKKVKEMNKTTYAKILRVDTKYSTEYDAESKGYVTTKSYSFTYEYTVNGMTFKGYGYEKRLIAPREGQYIKIYYNEMKPDKSETAHEHNQYLKLVIAIICIIAFFVITNIITGY